MTCLICFEKNIIKSKCITCIDSKICHECMSLYKKSICPICKKKIIKSTFNKFFLQIGHIDFLYKDIHS
jgi:hypothetical protein